MSTVNSNLPIYGVYGAGGCAKGVIPLAKRQLDTVLGSGAYSLVFVVDGQHKPKMNGYAVLTFDDFVKRDASSKYVSLAIANGETRQVLAGKCEEHEIEYFDICADNHIRMDDVEVAEGSIISPFVTFTSNIKIGRHFHANLYSYVEHDCTVGDFVTFAPGVRCNGNIIIEDLAYLGSGCVIKQGKPGYPLTIGAGATVGMGAVVTKDVAPGATVVGNPARQI